jgi:hypothetical protein
MGSNITCASAGALSLDSAASRAKGLRNLTAAAAILLASAGVAQASTTVNVTYTVSYTPNQVTQGSHTYNQGNSPTITGKLNISDSSLPGSGTWSSSSKTGTSPLVFSGFGSTLGSALFLEIAPNNSSCGSHCINYTQAGTLSVDFTFYDTTTGVTTHLDDVTGAYQAKYHSPSLACEGGNKSKSDCINWDTNDFVVNLGADTLALTLNDYVDWNLMPTIKFTLLETPHDIPQTPIPGALPLFVSGAGVFGVIGWRRKKRMAKQAGANVG